MTSSELGDFRRAVSRTGMDFIQKNANLIRSAELRATWETDEGLDTSGATGSIQIAGRVPASLTLTLPRTNRGLLLVVQSGGDQSDVAKTSAGQGLVRGGIGLAILRSTAFKSADEAASVALITEAVREIFIRGYAAPHNLFLESHGKLARIAVASVASRPEFFRGLVLIDPDLSSNSRIPPEHDRLGALVYFSSDSHAANKETLDWIRRFMCASFRDLAVLANHESRESTAHPVVWPAVEEAFLIQSIHQR